MAEQIAQTYANHTRWDPVYHFFVVPVTGINVVVAIWNLVKNQSLMAGWLRMADTTSRRTASSPTRSPSRA